MAAVGIHFGPILGHFEAMLGPKVCARTKEFLAQKKWGWCGTCLAYVGPCGGYVGPMLGLSSAILGASWGHVEAMFGPR